MKVVDLNLLLYAVNQDASQHARAHDWWQQAVTEEEPIGLTWTVVLGFLRIATRPGLFPRPLTCDEALEVVDGWLAIPSVVTLHPGERHWSILRGFLQRAGVAGNLTTDAHLAACAIEYDACLYSTDNDFARFGPELRFLNPIA